MQVLGDPQLQPPRQLPAPEAQLRCLFLRISVREYPELEGNPKDHRVQALALPKTPQEPHRVPESFVQTLLSSGRVGAVAIPWEAHSVPNRLFLQSSLTPSLILLYIHLSPAFLAPGLLQQPLFQPSVLPVAEYPEGFRAGSPLDPCCCRGTGIVQSIWSCVQSPSPVPCSLLGVGGLCLAQGVSGFGAQQGASPHPPVSPSGSWLPA